MNNINYYIIKIIFNFKKLYSIGGFCHEKYVDGQSG